MTDLTERTDPGELAALADELPRHEPVSLSAHGVHLAYDQRRVVHGIDLDVPPGRVTVIVGANGCGKSTLLRGLGRILQPVEGHVELDGRDLRRLRPKQVAAVLGLLPQQPLAPEGISVADLVARGRHPHQGAFRRRDPPTTTPPTTTPSRGPSRSPTPTPWPPAASRSSRAGSASASGSP